MSLAAAIKAMVALGFTAEQIGAVVEKVDGERREKARAGNAKRQAEHRARHPKSNANNGVTGVTSNGDNGVTPRARVVNTTSFPSVRKNLEDTPTASQCPQGVDEPKAKVSRNRGSRLPDDWRPSEELFSFGSEHGLSWPEVSAAFDEFRDYWLGVPGARGIKLDWDATFRNRLRDIAKRKTKPNARAGPRSSSNGVVEMLNELNGVGNVEPDHERPAKDITPAPAPEPGGREYPPRLFEPPRKPSGRETLDLRPTGPDFGGPSASYLAAWRTG